MQLTFGVQIGRCQKIACAERDRGQDGRLEGAIAIAEQNGNPEFSCRRLNNRSHVHLAVAVEVAQSREVGRGIGATGGYAGRTVAAP